MQILHCGFSYSTHFQFMTSKLMPVGRSVQKVYFSKTADWIRMPFGVVSMVGRGMGVLDGDDDHRRRGSFLGVNVGHPIEPSGDFIA